MEDGQRHGPTGYPGVDGIVAQLLAAVSAALGDSFVGMYLGGSLATGTFTPETSDVDFVVIAEHDITGDLAAALGRAHARITHLPSKWATKLEGLYVPRGAARSHGAAGTGEQRCAYLGVGGWFGVVPYHSDWIVQLHLVRERGIVVAGPDPKTLIDPVTPAELRAACAAIMRDNWVPLVDDPSRFDAEYQAYAVLTMCRLLYTLEHGAVVPKAAAAAWAKQAYGDQWNRWGDLVDGAVAWRPGMPFHRLEDVLDLVRHTIGRCRDGGPFGGSSGEAAHGGGSPERIRWAPKVRPEKIRRLYEQDARGLVDDELIDDVGLALHARCRSIVLVNAGQVACPRCGAVFKVSRTYRERARGEPAADPSEIARCPGCGWETTHGRWSDSWRHRELHAGWGLPPIQEFAERYPSARTPRERMLMIDRLLHQFHTNLKRAIQGRPVAVNLVEGNIRQVRALLDALSNGV